jgi:glyoxylase-like metal-dependent hydrolase (beta-lactamase superfamily II)
VADPTVEIWNCATLRPRLLGGTMPCRCLLVGSPRGEILVDTGLGRADVAQPVAQLGRGFLVAARPLLDEAETAVARLAARGLRPGDVRHIVLSHLDADHTGGLADFPDADVHVHADEIAAVGHPRFRPQHWAHGPRWIAHATAGGDRWLGLDCVRPVAGFDDLLLVPLPGHTPGHAGVAVRRGAGWLLFCGDAYFNRGELDAAATGVPVAWRLFAKTNATDRGLRAQTLARLQELVKEHPEVEVLSSHDPQGAD